MSSKIARPRKVATAKATMLPAASRELEIILWIASAIVAALGVFWLPWSFSSSTPVVGESFAFGFNNRFGILALGASILLGLGARYFGKPREGGYTWLQAAPRIFPPWKEATAEYAILLISCVLWSGGLLFWGSYLCDPAWCEARGFYYGMDLLALGLVPYRDFMFNYGPATIYLPYWLSNLTGGALSFEQSYPIILALFTVAGFVSFFIIIRSLEIAGSLRPLVLLLCVVVWAGFSMGLQYAPLRFVVVPATLVLLDAWVCRRTGSGIAMKIGIGLASAIAVTVCLAISPEMGISSTVGVMAYGFILMLRRSPGPALACWLGAVVAFCGTLLCVPDYLLSVFAFASGGSNFPIYPNLHNVCLVVICLLTLPALIASSLRNPAEKRAPLAASLGVAGGMLLPAALGRCDPGHVFVNSLIPVLMMFPVSATFGKPAFRVWAAVYALLYVVFLQVSYWSHYLGNYTYAIKTHDFYRQNPQVIDEWKQEWDKLKNDSPHGKKLHWSKVLPFPKGLDQFTSKGQMLLASGNEWNMWLARFLVLQKQAPHDYFHAYSQGAATPAQIERRIRDTEPYQFLIMPQSVLAPLAGQIDLAAYEKNVNTFLSKILVFPVNSTVRFSPYLPDTEYARRILASFQPVSTFDSYVILGRRNSQSGQTPESPEPLNRGATTQ